MEETGNTANKLPAVRQYLISLLVVALVTIFGSLLYPFAGFRIVGFMLLMSVSILALFMDLLPVILAAVLSALSWDYFFIPPLFTFTIGETEDRLLLLTYFMVVMIHAVFTHRIRLAQQEIRKREAKANAVKFYNTLLNSLSHELRTPITTIIGATDHLQAKGIQLTEEDKKELLSEISIASLRLNEQVENLLSMSRLESGVLQVKKDWVDVRELIYHTLRPFEPEILKWHVSVFAADNLPLFKLDYGLMERVLHNLISNAMQHTQEGTDIIIRADAAEDKLLLAVSDTGKGFPSGDLEKVFDKFYRVEGSHPGGTGLGLSIVKGFVEAHGGTVHLRNLPLSGAEFLMEIPTEMSFLSGLKNE